MDDQRRAYLYGIGAVLCWSTVATAFKLSLVHLTPAQLVLLASVVSWLFLAAVLAVTGKFDQVVSASPRDYRNALLLGGLNPFLYYLVLFKAYSLLPAQEAQALNYTWALTLALLAAPLLRQPLKRAEIVAALISYGGVLVIATRGQLLTLDFASPLGVSLALLSTVIWAFYWILNTGSRQDPLVGLFLNFCCAVPMLLVYCLWSGELTAVPWSGVAGAVYVGVFEMGVSFILWLHAMKLTRSTIRISSLIFMAPPLSLVLIHYVLGEVILPSTLGGLALILFGLVVQHRKGASANPGSAASIEKAIETQTVNTAVTNAGVEISGQFTRVLKDAAGNATYLQTAGPTRLAYQGVELDGHGIARHPDGFGSPVGRPQAMERCLSSYTIDELVQNSIEIGKPVTLEFRSGVTVGGSLTAIIRRDQKNLVFSFEQCTVTAHDGELLFDPAWGVYDMAVGDSVVSLTPRYR